MNLDLGAYLERIGYDGPVEPTLEDVYFAAIAGRLQPAALTLQPA